MKQGVKKYYGKHRDAFTAALILTPMCIWWVIVCGFPLVFGFILGFFKMRAVNVLPEFIGLQNFAAFFTSPRYLRDLWNTVWIGTLSALLINISGLSVAILMNRIGRLKGFYRSIWYLPAVTATIAIAQIISIIFDPVNGAFNKMLIGMGHDAISVDTDFGLGVLMIMVFSVWKGVGGASIIWLAGMQSVDRTQYEAAGVDGASSWNKFVHITLPGLKPIATYIIITGIIGAFQIFEPVAFITGGGPMEMTNVLVLRIIQDGFFNFDFGMAGASSLVLAFIVIGASLTFYKFSRENVEKDMKRAEKRLKKRYSFGSEK